MHLKLYFMRLIIRIDSNSGVAMSVSNDDRLDAIVNDFHEHFADYAGGKRERLVDERALALIRNRSVSAIRQDRWRGGPDATPFIRQGRQVRYRLTDVARQIAAKTAYRSTSEADDAATERGGSNSARE